MDAGLPERGSGRGLGTVIDSVRNALPKGRTLPPEEWRRRHRWMVWLLWAHVAGLAVFGLFHQQSPLHALTEAAILIPFAVAAQFLRLGQRALATITALGLLSASAILVHFSGGFIEAHFHYFVVMVLLTLYEAWWPYLIAVAFVLLQHGTIGVIDSSSVYNHPDAIAHPWTFAAIHAGFIAAAGGAAILAWRLNEDVRAELVQRRQQEEDASLARLQAERANQAKSEFLSRVSHELRTPLTVILGFTEILEDTNLASHQQSYVDKIRTASAHLHDLIKDVLDIGRIEEGQLSMSLRAVDARELIGTVSDLTHEIAALRRIRLTTAPGPDVQVLADEQRLKQVLINLVTNGIKYNREGGTVTIATATTTDGWVRIAVTDTGPGLTEANAAKLFIPFERLDAARRGVDGIGLGLALSKSLVDAMGGRIGVESPKGEGSTFWVELERAEGIGTLPAAEATESRTAAVTYLRARKILHVEDTQSNLSLVGSILKRRPSITIVPVLQGALAVQQARAHKPDLVLLDLHLPDMHGEQVMAALTADPVSRDIPVVILTADADPAQVERLLAAGASAYLTKPIQFEHFLAVIDAHLAGEPALEASAPT